MRQAGGFIIAQIVNWRIAAHIAAFAIFFIQRGLMMPLRW